MSDSPKSDPRVGASAEGSDEADGGGVKESPGVLASLPRTRPQLASPRRATARASAPQRARASTRAGGARKAPANAGPGGPGRGPAIARPAGPRKAAPRPASRRKPAANHRPIDEPAPRQGFEAEPDSLAGPVQPPGGTELVASAAELAGELAKSGVTTGARLLRDLLSRLPG